MDSPLMYEDGTPEKPANVTGKFNIDDAQLDDVLGLDPQLECSVDIQQMILDATKVTQPLQDSELLFDDISDEHIVKQELFDLVHPSEEDSYMQTEKTDSTTFDLNCESSVDIQALLQITRPTIVKPEKSSELSECIFSVSAQSEPLPLSVGAVNSGTATLRETPSITKKSSRKKRVPDKGTVEYLDKRARNNVAVRRSRTKAKERHQQTEGRVKDLSDENERLQKKVDLLSKELNVLKSLFLNVGAALPANFEAVLQK